MKEYVITIDGGTTNTRCMLWNGQKEMVAEAKRETGVRNTSIDGNNEKLKQAVKECVEEVLRKAGIGFDAVRRITGSGMITSDMGLYMLPWITAPAGAKELAEHAEEVLLPEICPVPITFIPGIKNSEGPFSMENIAGMDIMRGEEVESVALISRMKCHKEMLLVLPGSHNKFIPVDRDGRITGCVTSISGELLSAVTNDTILAKSVNRSFVSPEGYDRETVLAGFDTAMKYGFGKALFTGRTMMLFTESGPEKIANFLLGATLAGDLIAVKNSGLSGICPEMKVVVAGKEPLRSAVADILRHDGYFTDVSEYRHGGKFPLSAEGQYLVAGFFPEEGPVQKEGMDERKS